MSWRLLLVVLSLAFSGCDWECNASTCAAGCCDSNGTCMLNGGDNACGLGGRVCTSCLSTTSCSMQGVCVTDQPSCLSFGSTCSGNSACCSKNCRFDSSVARYACF